MVSNAWWPQYDPRTRRAACGHRGRSSNDRTGLIMANKFLEKAKRWFSKPENREKAKRAARSAYNKYKRRK